MYLILDITTVNPGYPVNYRRSGASHGGSGGRVQGQTQRTAKAYGHIFEPETFGSSGGIGYHSTSYGGNGGGIIHLNVTGRLFVDGQITSDGAPGPELASGGGSGGSIWAFVNEIAGYGRIAADGGDGYQDNSNPGGGGGGGRVAIYYHINSTMSDFTYDTFGGAAGSANAEPGGSGTAFVYSIVNNHTTLILGNEGKECFTFENVIQDYNDLENDGCRSWIIPTSHTHAFAHAMGLQLSYHFSEIQIYGATHFAIETENVGDPLDLDFLYMIGDRTGTIHIGDQQVRVASLS